MRAPLCSDSTELCPEEQGIGSESESSCEIQAIEKSFEKFHPNKTAIFGICLDNLMGTTPQVAPQIPFILSRLCHYIEEHGLHCKHLFSEGAERNIVESLKIDFIESGDAPLEATGNVASVAKLLIVFFEELPEPLIPLSSQQDFFKDMEKLSLDTENCVSHLRQSVNKLPQSAYHVLKYLSRFLLRVASHKEYNEMSSDKLSVIFGPVIFRLSSDDPMLVANVKKVMNSFVQNYQAIFEDEEKCVSCNDKAAQKPYSVVPDSNHRRQIPCPSSVMPVMTLMPLSVVIPSVNATVSDDSKSKENVPVLLIERQLDGMPKPIEGKSLNLDGGINHHATRKRKERRLSGEDSQPRSSSEERPAPTSLISLDKIDLMRRCSSHEEMKEGTIASETKLECFTPKDIPKSDSRNLDSYVSDSDMVVNEKNHSPHPPNAKRREVESTVLHQSNYNFMTPPWINSNKYLSKNSSSDTSDCNENIHNFKVEQNSIAEMEVTNTMECDISDSLEIDEHDSINNNDQDSFLDNQSARIPRSASCPVPSTDNNNNSEEEHNSLSLSWSMLFESEDSEPVRSEQRYSWPLTKDTQEDTALLSPSVQSLRKSSYYEAPLSPSAYRSYLSYRSHHLDPSVPPSPPVEQEDFAKTLDGSSVTSDSIKTLTKRIHSIKRRIRKFDEKFEADFGYKPSHAEKANNSDTKKLMNDLHKARKELKALKEESHLEQVSPASWHASKCAVLGDSTNHVNNDVNDKLRPTIEETFGTAMRSLCDERKTANRPECLEAMSTSQVKEEKLAIQKALLEFESIHGKPSTKEERNTIRPLYDRYRCVKRMLVRSGSFPGAISKNKEICSELQPILEHETMDFTSPQHRTEVTAFPPDEDIITSKPDSSNDAPQVSYTADDTKSSHVLAVKYDNSNIHELPLSEMIFQLQQVKSEKRHLRKILREFESEFLRLNGRKVQKEDKAPVDALYGEYKHVKARLKLLEALISKHDQHQLM